MSHPLPSGPAGLAESLLGTLDAEHAALDRLRAGFGAQLDAVRRRDHDALDAATAEAHEIVAELDRHRTTRARQTRLLGKVLRLPTGDTTVAALADGLAPMHADLAGRLRETRDRLRAAAAEVYADGEEVEFALGYAADLSREIMQTLQQHGVDAPTQVYTKRGYAASTTPTRSFLNELG